MDTDMAPPVPPVLASLKLLRILTEEGRSTFFSAVARQLCAAPSPGVSAAILHDAYSLDFTSGEPAQLLLAAKVLLTLIASRAYHDDGSPAALLADLTSAIGEGAAKWVQEAAEAATLPCAAQIRAAQAHATAALGHDYLQDFDWQATCVLGSSALASMRVPLVQLQLRIRKAGSPVEVTEQMELSLSELDATIASLKSAVDAVATLPAPA